MPCSTAYAKQVAVFEQAVLSAMTNPNERILLLAKEGTGSVLCDHVLNSLSDAQKAMVRQRKHPQGTPLRRAIGFASGSAVYHGLIDVRAFVDLPPITKTFLEMPSDVAVLSTLMEEIRLNSTRDAQLIMLSSKLAALMKTALQLSPERRFANQPKL
jgi:hypothetical protein